MSLHVIHRQARHWRGLPALDIFAIALPGVGKLHLKISNMPYNERVDEQFARCSGKNSSLYRFTDQQRIFSALKVSKLPCRALSPLNIAHLQEAALV
jgi:hypothetical protein